MSYQDTYKYTNTKKKKKILNQIKANPDSNPKLVPSNNNTIQSHKVHYKMPPVIKKVVCLRKPDDCTSL